MRRAGCGRGNGAGRGWILRPLRLYMTALTKRFGLRIGFAHIMQSFPSRLPLRSWFSCLLTIDSTWAATDGACYGAQDANQERMNAGQQRTLEPTGRAPPLSFSLRQTIRAIVLC
jgi:hypothetical protein